MLEKPQSGLLENLSIVESVKQIDNRYCTVLENFKSCSKLKGVNPPNRSSKFLLREFRHQSICDIFRNLNSDMLTPNTVIKKQLTCQSRETPTESNTKILRPKRKYVLNWDPQDEYSQERILMTKSGDLGPTVINGSSEDLLHQSTTGQKRRSIEEREFIKGRSEKTEDTDIQEKDGVLSGAERTLRIHQGDDRNPKDRDMVKKNCHNTRSTRKHNDCSLQTSGPGHVGKVRHHGIKSNEPHNMAGYQYNPCFQNQVPRTTKRGTCEKRSGAEEWRKGSGRTEDRGKRTGTGKGRTKGRWRKNLSQGRTDAKRVKMREELSAGHNLLDFYLKLLWGLIMNLLLKSLKKSVNLFKKKMTKVKKTSRIKIAETKLFNDDFG